MVIISDIQLPKNDDGILKVSDVSTAEGGDLSARTTITDPTTSTFVKTDTDGRLNVLESSVEGAGSSNSLNSTEYAVKQMGAFDGSAYRVAKCKNDGKLQVELFGNTASDGSGTSHVVHTDTNGNLRVSTVSTVNTAPANSVNSGITNDPANSVAVGLRGRTDKDLASTETFINCDTDGKLIISNTQNIGVKLEDLSSTMNADLSNHSRTLAVGLRGRTNISDHSTGTFLLCNSSGHLVTALKSKEQVDIFSVGTSVSAGGSTTSNSLELKGRGKAHIFIKTGSANQSGSFQLSGDGNNFYLPSTGGLLTSVGTPTADILVAEVETGARYIRVIYNNTGGSGTNVITSSKLTYA